MTTATMPKASRKSVDFLDLIDEIIGYKDTPEWKALSFGAKVRLIITDAVNAKKSNSQMSLPLEDKTDD